MKKLVLSLSFLLILQCTLTTEHCKGQWYPLPVFPTYLETSDVKFFDENTGILLVTNPTPVILRTTNSGQSWTQIKNCYTSGNQKIDSSTFYTIAVTNGYPFLLRTFNKGLTWDSVSTFSGVGYNKLSFVNRDTGWVSGWDSGVPYIWRTTNGGVTLTIQAGSNVGGGEVFFYNQKVNGEYIGWVNNVSALWKTTNSGNNWFQVACPGTDLVQITFINENTGWVSNGINGMFKSTNGGLNWVNQPLAPDGGSNIVRTITRFKVIDSNLLYGVKGYRYLPSMIPSALIWVTTNGGQNWGFQLTDTSYHLGWSLCIDFINAQTGWTFGEYGLHTTNGGGQIIFTSISKEESVVKEYTLFQNYPNPFNPETNIKYQVSKSSVVRIEVLDILGKNLQTLINEKHTPGTYQIKFNGETIGSGIYFYRLIVDNKVIQSRKMILLK
ncbi:MAG: T9SS type A sorting domain-containing protein [Ignavibacteriota bacterium]